LEIFCRLESANCSQRNANARRIERKIFEQPRILPNLEKKRRSKRYNAKEMDGQLSEFNLRSGRNIGLVLEYCHRMIEAITLRVCSSAFIT